MSSTQNTLESKFASFFNNSANKEHKTFDYLGNLKKTAPVIIPSAYIPSKPQLKRDNESSSFPKSKATMFNRYYPSNSSKRSSFIDDDIIKDNFMIKKGEINDNDYKRDLIYLHRQKMLESNKSIVPFLRDGLYKVKEKEGAKSSEETKHKGDHSTKKAFIPPVNDDGNNSNDEFFLKEIFGLSDTKIEEEAKLIKKEIEASNKNKKLESLLVGHKPNFKADINAAQNDAINNNNQRREQAINSSANLAKLNPHINPLKRTSCPQHYFKFFKFSKNEIYEKVLDFSFYNTQEKTNTAIVPDTFESEQHYKFIWITNFFNELRHCLLAEKGEKKERQNYIEMSVAVSFLYQSNLEDKLAVFKLNPNKKLSDLKKKILKENDLIAFYPTTVTIPNDNITFRNKTHSPYFMGLIQLTELNELTCIVHINAEDTYNLSSSTTHGILYNTVYLGNLTSSLREYNAVLNLELSNFTGLLYTKELFNQPNNNPNQSTPIKSSIFLNKIKEAQLFNPSQTEAISRGSSMKTRDILLIQGPPGTGKTHTILGIISLFLLNNDGRILICAPSNTAIDEISARIAVKGLLDEKLQQINPIFVRFGLYDRIEKEKKYLNSKNGRILQNYSLEKLSDDKYKVQFNDYNRKIEKVEAQLAEYRLKEIKCTPAEKNEIVFAIKELRTQRHHLLLSLQDVKNEKKSYEYELLSKTRILCTTLNSSGSERLKRMNIAFDYLIIDEACQCVEPSSLIPLCHDVKKLVMVGDHMQLPATVFSDNATITKYNRSLFERLIDNNYPRYILTIQYRMHPNIRDFIGKVFYDSQLSDAPKAAERLTKSTFYNVINHKQNFAFFDLEYGKEELDAIKKSYRNNIEVSFCIEIMKTIHKKISKYNKAIINKNDDYFTPTKGQLPHYHYAVITPYKSQVLLLIDEISKEKDLANVDIEVNTVDSFQGREQDIVIFSCVRANFVSSNGENTMTTTGIGFLNDYRRMNVALSRAKLGCFIVGNAKTLVHNDYWKNLLQFCIEKQAFYTASNEYKAKNAIKPIFTDYLEVEENDEEEGEIKQPQLKIKLNDANMLLGKKRELGYQLSDPIKKRKILKTTDNKVIDLSINP